MISWKLIYCKIIRIFAKLAACFLPSQSIIFDLKFHW